jgi:hypothetical protein
MFNHNKWLATDSMTPYLVANRTKFGGKIGCFHQGGQLSYRWEGQLIAPKQRGANTAAVRAAVFLFGPGTAMQDGEHLCLSPSEIAGEAARRRRAGEGAYRISQMAPNGEGVA